MHFLVESEHEEKSRKILTAQRAHAKTYIYRKRVYIFIQNIFFILLCYNNANKETKLC